MAGSGEGRASLLGAKLGNYAVQALVGRGAMGAVYLARDRSLNRPVALKVLLGSLARNRDQVRRFLREAKAAAPLVHPNIVRIYDAGVRDGVPFIAMEYVEGEPLDRFLKRTGALDWHHALHIAQQVAQALACAHAAGVVHRDVKPANILLDAHGRVRLTDFGIARILDPNGSGFTTHECLGTPEYMSPELCAGEKVGPPADLFSLGVTLFYMLAGRMPFHGDSHVALVQSITNEEAPRLNRVMLGVPDDVARLVAHLLEKNPSARPESAAAVVSQFERLHQENGGASALPEALQAFIQEEAQPRKVKNDTPVPGRSRRGPRVKVSRKKRRYTAISGAAQAAAAVMLLVTAAGLGYWKLAQPAPLPPEGPRLTAAPAASAMEGGISFELPAPHWIVESLNWSPDGEAVIAKVAGRPGTAAQGSSGLLALRPDGERIQSVLPPGVGQVSAGTVRFSDTSTFAAYTRAGVGPDAGFTLLTQHWNEAHPRREVRATFARDAWMGQGSNPWSAPDAGAAVLSPDGKRACVLLYDTATGENYLAEVSLSERAGNPVPARLTTSGAQISKKGLRYTPDGKHIVYLREKGKGERELWIVASGGQERNGSPIAIGKLDDAIAFSPDSSHAVVSLMGEDAYELVLVDVQSGDIVSRLGSGRISDEAFHPSGNFLIVQAYCDDTRHMQLWAVESDAPYRRQQISTFRTGVVHPASVSADGHWAATAISNATGDQVTLIDLTRLLFTAGSSRGLEEA